MNDRNHELFDDYFKSVFERSNTLSKEEFERSSLYYDALYGAHLPVSPDARILDIGCGTGGFLYYLQKKGYRNFAGIDISASQIEFCSAHVSEHAIVADAFDHLQGTSFTYDLIVSNDTLEHLPKEKVIAFLKLVLDALKPGGALLLKVPNAANPFALYLRYKDFTHESGYTDVSLYQALYLAGFRNIALTSSYAPFTLQGRFVERPFLALFHYVLRKLYWWQGFVAPKIMSPSIIAVARRENGRTE